MSSSASPHGEKSKSSIFDIPPPLKRLFDRFPLVLYPANELPARAPRDRSQHALYVFTTPKGAVLGAPSYNPSCLKWQVCFSLRVTHRL
jgi:metaxin